MFSLICRWGAPVIVVSFIARASAAQPAPAPADDDLEIPAAPEVAPSAPTAAPSEPARQPERAQPPELARQPEAQVPTSPQVSTPTPGPMSVAPAAPAWSDIDPGSRAARTKSGASSTIVNLERSTHSRPVPQGFVIGGFVQGELFVNALSEDQIQQGGTLLNQDAFQVRRARLRLDHGWEYAAATLELDANTVRGARVGIRRAEASLSYQGSNPGSGAPLVMVTLGATDLPFGYELMESARTRFFMERSLGSLSVFPTEADVGLKLSGAASFLRYAVAVTNGEPLNDRGLPRDPNAAKDVTGRIGVETAPTPSLAISGGTSFSVGKGFHAGQQATKDTVLWTDDDGNGSVSLGELVGVPGSAASPSRNFDRWALGLDLQLGFVTPLGRTRLFAEAFAASNYDRGLFQSDPIASGADIRHLGGYAAVVQDVTDYGVIGFRASFYDPNSDVLDERRGRFLSRDQTIETFSPLIGAVLKDRARLLFQYDFVRDHLARDTRGIPTDANNDQFTARLQVDL